MNQSLLVKDSINTSSILSSTETVGTYFTLHSTEKGIVELFLLSTKLIFVFFKENSSLSVIEKIVEKFFTQTNKTTNKKRLLSRKFGTSVTDIDELVLSSIKKKKKKIRRQRRRKYLHRKRQLKNQ